MLFLYNLEPVYLLLTVLISVRVVLNGTNFAALVTVFVTCLLSFTLFESFFAFSPLIFFFLKKHFSFFASAKTFLLKIKNSLFPGKRGPENETVFMVKGKEKGTAISEKSTSPVSTEGQSDNPKRGWEKLKRGQQEYDQLVNEAQSSALNPEPTGIGSLTLSKPLKSIDNSLYRGVGSSSNEQGNNLPQGSSAQNLVVPRDRPSGDSDYSPGSSPSLTPRLRHSHNPNSPLEENLETNRYIVWIGSGSCAYILLNTTRIPWVILKKLDYTQELVKKMTDKGWPKFLFFWISHPESGPVGGKPLFTLLVGILTGNIIVLYIIMRIVYWVP